MSSTTLSPVQAGIRDLPMLQAAVLMLKNGKFSEAHSLFSEVTVFPPEWNAAGGGGGDADPTRVPRILSWKLSCMSLCSASLGRVESAIDEARGAIAEVANIDATLQKDSLSKAYLRLSNALLLAGRGSEALESVIAGLAQGPTSDDLALEQQKLRCVRSLRGEGPDVKYDWVGIGHNHSHSHEDDSPHSHSHSHEDDSPHSHSHSHEDDSHHSHSHSHKDDSHHSHSHSHKDDSPHTHSHSHKDNSHHSHPHEHEDPSHHSHYERENSDHDHYHQASSSSSSSSSSYSSSSSLNVHEANRSLLGYLSQDDISLFYQQGYVVKRKCLDEETLHRSLTISENAIARCLEHVTSIVANGLDDGEKGKEQIAFLSGSRVVYKQFPDCATGSSGGGNGNGGGGVSSDSTGISSKISIARINGAFGVEPLLASLLRSERMVYTFSELLGTCDLEHIICQIHPKLPGDKVDFPKHKDIQFRKLFDPDWTDILGNGSYAICIMPIDPMSRSNGGLWVDSKFYLNYESAPEWSKEDEDHVVWIDANPGDLLFMHPHLYHGSHANNSDRSRRTLLTGFCAFGANHKAYPGADVSVHVKITGNDSGDRPTISLTNAPWKTDAGITGEAHH